MLQIGSQKIETNIFLAALAGCSDLPFRLIAREHGAGFCFYEMADSNSLVFTSRQKNIDMLEPHPKDSPIAAQLLGADPAIMLKAASRVLEINPKISFLDINAACPVRKVIKKESGAYLIHKPAMLYRIIEELASKLPLPITVKLRTGYKKMDRRKITLIAKHCEASGAQAIFIHGRTQAQLYAGNVDHASIKAVKDSVKIPVLASGNIFSPQKAKEMLDLTGCDGVMVARGAFGNPWIFEHIKHYLQTGERLPEPSLEEKLNVLKRHLEYIEQYKNLPKKSKVGVARKVAIWYLKGFQYATVLRNSVTHAQSMQELYNMLELLHHGTFWCGSITGIP